MDNNASYLHAIYLYGGLHYIDASLYAGQHVQCNHKGTMLSQAKFIISHDLSP